MFGRRNLSGTEHGGTPDERDFYAAEYVIGLLSPAERQAVEMRAAADPVMAASIEAWQRRLNPLAAATPPQTPPDAIWRRLEAAIGAPPADQGTTRAAALRRADALQKARRKIVFWQSMTFVGTMCGAALAFMIVAPKLLISKPAVAALTTQNSLMPAFLVMVTKDGSVTIIATAAEVQPGNVLQLWRLPEGATVPISLGLLPTMGQVKIKAIVTAGTQLLVSSEPLGGSPTGMPTGPVVYSGKVVAG